MPQKSNTFLQYFVYCLLIGFTNALIGRKVHNAKQHQYPFVVSIARISVSVDIHNFHLCTGSLISHKSILTVAHCLADKKPDEVEIIAGSVNLKEGTRYRPESWITFDQWERNKKEKYHMNDIAVIIVKDQGITNVQTASIPWLHHDKTYWDITNITIAGWGASESGKKIMILKTAQLSVISNEECSQRGTGLKGKKFSVPPNYFCSRADPYVLSSCGDGGAPILDVEHELVAINIGVCPNLEGYTYHPDYLKLTQMNSHLHLYFYEEFIRQVWK